MAVKVGRRKVRLGWWGMAVMARGGMERLVRLGDAWYGSRGEEGSASSGELWYVRAVEACQGLVR